MDAVKLNISWEQEEQLMLLYKAVKNAHLDEIKTGNPKVAIAKKQLRDLIFKTYFGTAPDIVGLQPRMSMVRRGEASRPEAKTDMSGVPLHNRNVL